MAAVEGKELGIEGGEFATGTTDARGAAFKEAGAFKEAVAAFKVTAVAFKEPVAGPLASVCLPMILSAALSGTFVVVGAILREDCELA